MQRVATTVLALVGSPSQEELRRLALSLGEAPNVRAVVPEDKSESLDRAVAAWREVTRAHIPYLVHDADPLVDVASAWVDRWDGAGDVGRLEVAVQQVVQRWRARSLELPDYYLVIDPEGLPPTARHWFLGVLSGASAHRVVVAGSSPDETVRAVRRLRAGPWWPELDVLMDGIDRRAPDTMHVRDAAQGPSTGVIL